MTSAQAKTLPLVSRHALVRIYERQVVMRAHILFAIPVLAMIHAGCGGADSASASSGSNDPVERPLRLTLGAEVLGAGESSTGMISLSRPAPDDGVVVELWSSDLSALIMPNTLAIAAGDDTATFAVTNSYDGEPKEVKIAATYEGARSDVSLFVPAQPVEPPVCRTHFCTK
jgi:hypothetical protein